MKILGIETSCDETAASIVDESGTILSSLVLSQLKEHKAFGGVDLRTGEELDAFVAAAFSNAGALLEASAE